MGPCMCGDPYCGSCGSPGAAEAAEAEAFIDAIIETLVEKGIESEDDFEEILEMTRDAFKYRKMKEEIAELEAERAEADRKVREAEQLNAILEQVEATPKFDEEQVVIYEIGKSSGRRELAIELSLLLPASDDKAIRTIAEYLKDVIEETEPAQ